MNMVFNDKIVACGKGWLRAKEEEDGIVVVFE